MFINCDISSSVTWTPRLMKAARSSSGVIVPDKYVDVFHYICWCAFKSHKLQKNKVPNTLSLCLIASLAERRGWGNGGKYICLYQRLIKKGARVYKQTNDMIAVDREVRCSTLILIPPPPFFWHYSPFPLLKFCFFPNKFWPWNLLKMNCSHATINILALGKTSNLGRNKSLKEEKTNAWIYMKK